MSKLKVTKPETVVKVLLKIGFKPIRQSGSHLVLRRESDGKWTTVPIHKGKDVAKGTLRKILRDAGLSVEEFNKLTKRSD